MTTRQAASASGPATRPDSADSPAPLNRSFGAAGTTGPAGLRRFTGPPPPAEQRCELCAQPVADGHRHLVDTEHRSLACACAPCALLFDRPGAARGRYRTVPDRYLVDPDHRLGEAAWNQLQIPVGIAFFFRNSAQDRLVALYPSPAGATESELDPAGWQAVLDGTRLAALLEPDVEALLVRRSATHAECLLVPIDVCYELVGRLRLHWQGFDGGSRARAELADFFTRVTARARTTPQREEPR